MIRAVFALVTGAILASSLCGCSYSGSPEAVCLSTLDSMVADFTAASVVESITPPEGGLILHGAYDDGAFECTFSGDPLKFVKGYAETGDGGRIDVLP